MKAVELAHRQHVSYRADVDQFVSLIVSTTETLDVITSSTRAASKEQLQETLVKLNVSCKLQVGSNCNISVSSA